MTSYLIDFYNSASDGEIQQYLNENQCSVQKVFSNLNKVYLVDCESTPPLTSIVEYVTIDNHTTALNLLDVVTVPHIPPTEEKIIDSTDNKNWWKIYSLKNFDHNNEQINTHVWGNKVNVYLVDSGIDATHPEFVGCDITNIYSVTGEYNDTKGHGTALASLIVGNTCSMTNTKLKIVKIFEAGRPTLQSELLSAFDAIISDSSTSTNKFSVVNLSWAIPKNEYIERKIRILVNSGVSVVAAAGNSGTPIGDVTPAGMHEVLTVGSYNSNLLPSNFSDYTDPTATSLTQNLTNHGELDCWAPGENIYVATIGGGYGYSAGTSLSAAILSGAVAYNMSKFQYNNDVLSIYRRLDGTFNYNHMDGIYRTGMLDLSDEKYSKSQNYICTYKNEFRESFLKIITPLTLETKTNGRTWAMFYALSTTTSYEFLDPLPDGATIERNFVIYQPIKEIPDPTRVETAVIRYIVTTTDGMTFENTLTFHQVGGMFDPEKLPPDDPILDIRLKAVEPYPPCGQYGPPNYCTNLATCNIGASQCVQPPTPVKGAVCSCATG